MALLPIFQTSDTSFTQMQNKWASQLNPVLSNPSLQTNILKKISLSTGNNAVNHLLGKALTGWRIVRQRAKASIYDNQDNNATPNLTLLLISDNPVVCDIEVF